MSIYEYRIPERNYDQDKIKKQIFIKSKMGYKKTKDFINNSEITVHRF